ncbi:MAG: hypothetical protein U0P45_10775 [Acidimicrobiales bacterium]
MGRVQAFLVDAGIVEPRKDATAAWTNRYLRADVSGPGAISVRGWL